MNQRLGRLLRLVFILLDFLILNLAFLLSKNIFSRSVGDDSGYLHFYINLAWVVCAWFSGVYTGESVSNFGKFSRNTVRVFLYFLLVIMLYPFLFRTTEIPRLYFALMVLLTAGGLIFLRSLHLFFFHYLFAKNDLGRKIVIIGHNNAATKLAEYLGTQPVKISVIGCCEDEENMSELTPYPILGPIKSAMDISLKCRATDVYSTISPEQNHEIYSFARQADDACIHFKFIPDLSSFIRLPVHVAYLGQLPMFSLRKEPLDDLANRIKKRLYDLSFAFLVSALILSWLVPLLGLIIRLDSKGPVFYMQKRTGINKKTFSCIKFRSMRMNKDADKQQASRNDPRITRLGRFLRKSNLDELPQFFNVLMGDMSIVGPRPHMLKHTEDYSKLVPSYMVRQFLKPGITGWAQINGYRGETKTLDQMKGRVSHDLWYLENWSLWLDSKIIALTLVNMLRGEKNAF